MADADHAFLHELFSVFGSISVRRMFSGVGLFRDGLMFGLVVRDVIYLKADTVNEPAFEREGAPPFSYQRKGGATMITSLRRLPERLYDDPDELAAWTREAFAAAQRKAAAKPARGRAKATLKPPVASARGRREGRSRG